MKKAFFFLLVAWISLPALAQQPRHMPHNVILMGWDGCHRDHVKALLKEGKLPHLEKLIADGTLVDIDVMEVTATRPGWTQVLTGYNAKVTGVYSNSNYRPIPKGYTVLERVRALYGPQNVVTAAIVGKKVDVDNDPPQKIPLSTLLGSQSAPDALDRVADSMPGELVEENGKKFWVIPGKPYLYTSQNIDIWINGLLRNDRVGDKTVELLAKCQNKPFFFFVHLAEIDANGHLFGEQSPQYNEAIVSCDQQLGRIVDQLKELKLYEKTYIYITADHGFDIGQRNHKDAPYIFLATNDPKVIRGGTRADITPTILDRLGFDLSIFSPPLDGQSLARPRVGPELKRDSAYAKSLVKPQHPNYATSMATVP